MDIYKMVLASQSPRRIEILKKHGLDPLVIPADIDESLPNDMDVKDAVMYLSLKKALYIENSHLELSGALIIAADTVVYKDKILGKPANRSEAYNMIKSINGASHYAVTGVSLIVAGKPVRRSFYAITKVFCKRISQNEINSYIDTDEPYDKAGGYAIQGEFSKYIDHIDGDYENVVGLPFAQMMKEIEKL